MINLDHISRREVLKLIHEMFNKVDSSPDLDLKEKCCKESALLNIERKVNDMPSIYTGIELTPCDPSLLNHSVEEFLRIVDDASVFGIEVVVHDGKLYYTTT